MAATDLITPAVSARMLRVFEDARAEAAGRYLGARPAGEPFPAWTNPTSAGVEAVLRELVTALAEGELLRDSSPAEERIGALLAGGAGLIARERARQVSEEGYDAEHDRDHLTELTLAAVSYANRVATGPLLDENDREVPDFDWPWHADYWKPTGDPVRDLTKAGALIAAAIDSALAATGPANTEGEADR